MEGLGATPAFHRHTERRRWPMIQVTARVPRAELKAEALLLHAQIFPAASTSHHQGLIGVLSTILSAEGATAITGRRSPDPC